MIRLSESRPVDKLKFYNNPLSSQCEMQEISPVRPNDPQPMDISSSINLSSIGFNMSKTACDEKLAKSPVRGLIIKSSLKTDRSRFAQGISFLDNSYNGSILNESESGVGGQPFFSCGVIGKGSFGCVIKAMSVDDEQEYAIKMARKRYSNESERKRVVGEIRHHETLPYHQNIVKFHKAWEKHHQIFILLELCSMDLGKLFGRMDSVDALYPWCSVVDVLRGLNHVHDNGIFHLDIKPKNIYLGLDSHFKIGDFGCACRSDEKIFAVEGDSDYKAPELKEGHPPSIKADIFSLGTTLEFLFSTLSSITSNLHPDKSISRDSLFNCIKMMTKRQADDRPSCSDLLSTSIDATIQEISTSQQTRDNLSQLLESLKLPESPETVESRHYSKQIIKNQYEFPKPENLFLDEEPISVTPRSFIDRLYTSSSYNPFKADAIRHESTPFGKKRLRFEESSDDELYEPAPEAETITVKRSRLNLSDQS